MIFEFEKFDSIFVGQELVAIYHWKLRIDHNFSVTKGIYGCNNFNEEDKKYNKTLSVYSDFSNFEISRLPTVSMAALVYSIVSNTINNNTTTP